MSSASEDLKLCQQGYVYVVLDNHNRVKIGKSLAPEKRIKNIASSSGIIIEDVFITDALFGYSELEIYLHAKFSNYRCVGEWFNCRFDDVITFVESMDMSEFNQEKYIDLSGVTEIIDCLQSITKSNKMIHEEGLIDPLVDVIEYMVGTSDKPLESLKYRASPESHKRIQSAILKQFSMISKLEYLVNRCEALETLNDCYSERLYLDSELYSRLKDTSEIDTLNKGYHDMQMGLLKKSSEALKVIIKPYASVEVNA